MGFMKPKAPKLPEAPKVPSKQESADELRAARRENKAIMAAQAGKANTILQNKVQGDDEGGVATNIVKPKPKKKTGSYNE